MGFGLVACFGSSFSTLRDLSFCYWKVVLLFIFYGFAKVRAERWMWVNILQISYGKGQGGWEQHLFLEKMMAGC
jgi:hypothetical protein